MGFVVPKGNLEEKNLIKFLEERMFFFFFFFGGGGGGGKKKGFGGVGGGGGFGKTLLRIRRRKS